MKKKNSNVYNVINYEMDSVLETTSGLKILCWCSTKVLQ